jgi:predicted HTH domain antitoxin
MNVSVEFPNTLLLAARDEPEAFVRRVMIYTLGHLYIEGKISSGVGAQVLGCSRLEFYRLLSERWFDVIDYAEGDLEAEAATSREIAARLETELNRP